MAGFKTADKSRAVWAVLLIAAGALGGVWWLVRGDEERSPGKLSRSLTVGIRNGSSTQSRQSAAASRSEPRALVRINLTPTPVERLQLAIDGPYTVRLIETGQKIGSGRRLAQTTVEQTDGGFRIGRRRYRGTAVEIVPDVSPAIWAGDHQYRGVVRLYSREGGKLIAVNVLPLSDYLASVVDSEMPAAFPRAAREAQAIVARTYALYHMAAARAHRDFDLYATTRSQNYLGYQYRDPSGRRLAGESSSSRSIVRSTAGLVCTRGGRLIPAYYSAVCGGRTTPGGEVFADANAMRGVRCAWCRESKFYRWTAKLNRDEASQAIRRYLSGKSLPFGRLTSLVPIAGVSGGHAAEYQVGDGGHEYRIARAAFRRKIFPTALHSLRFIARLDGDHLLFEGRGRGHGVGLCQWGARGLALSGQSAAAIVGYYYPGTRLSRIPQRQTRWQAKRPDE
ncbi:MAG: SpoIID/LytB domain-containing protein [Planctomycetes bacterium]|nr:SpoIID/LytB domain-containing protein [Planctomycetota bacterium]